MKFDLTKPCGNCPFRKDRAFGLTEERVLEILGGGKGHWWPADSFACHKTIDYSKKDSGRVLSSSQQCAGVMAILLKEGKPNTAMQIAERLKLWDPSRLDPTAPFYESTQAAIDGQTKRRSANEKVHGSGARRRPPSSNR